MTEAKKCDVTESLNPIPIAGPKVRRPMQNTSHAVMAQRSEAADSPDDFPTPPWATRALCEHLLAKSELKSQTCLEPACGRGHMARPLSEYFGAVEGADAYHYGFGPVRDFLNHPYEAGSHDWVITNPPFRLAEEFILRALVVARRGIAVLARSVFLESSGRFNTVFSQTPPAAFGQFVERVPMVKGRLDKEASTATSYAWFVWDKRYAGPPLLKWIPPCRKALEREGDYSERL